MALFHPTMYIRRITDVTAEDLRTLGAEGILLDVDNTLTTHGSQQLSPAVEHWLQRVRADGFCPVIVSNNDEARVQPFAGRIGLPYVSKAGKPLPRGFREAAQQLGLPFSRCVVIGDQLFTDIAGANLAGMRSILLQPIQPETDQPFIQFKRRLEAVLLRGHHPRRETM